MQIIQPATRDLGDFSVRRLLPAAQCRSVGPFVFFDHFGPVQFPPGKGVDVRPHPHIGLATLTYLFEGEIVHRDSLGEHQVIRPGAVNLMTAGRGIVHSERSGADLDEVSSMHGLQTWMALPNGGEECDPAFVHYPADSIPRVTDGGIRVNVVAGQFAGALSPVQCAVPTLYLDIHLPAGATITLPEETAEIALFVVDGEVELAGEPVPPLAMGRPGAPGASVAALGDSHVVAVGGDPVGERFVWWNFVSSSRERIREAADQWRDGGFPKVPGDEEEFIPLPDTNW